MLTAFLVCLFAGLATAIGGLLALHPRLRQPAGTAVALAFAAGAMIAVSLIEIIPRSFDELSDADMSGGAAAGATALAVAAGVGVVWLVSRLIPHRTDPADIAGTEAREGADTGPDTRDAADIRTQVRASRAMRSGVLVAVAVTLHNIPEGLTTFLATLADPALGITLAVAIAIHNIPEGAAVATPILAATGSRTKAVGWATVSGLAEPAGALLGYALLHVMLPEEWFSVTFGLIAGMMIAISVRELLPVAWRYHPRVRPLALAILAGVGVMVLSLLMLA